ncbi:MAG: multidrug ABC transporter substrate-binding protein [Fimbriimonadales bacterium]|nr:MAG: multidrug ABC transporter substrate-binding protein [Fimbriimonadales bacterium]
MLGKSFQAALESIWMTPRRTLLSGLGMAVGVAAIVVLVSLGKGVQRDVVSQVESLGVNLVIVLPGRLSAENPFNPMSFIGLSTLRAGDIQAVAQVPGVRRVAPIMFVAGAAQRGDRWADAALILGTTPEWFEMRPHTLKYGRFFTDAEANQRVCILGPKPAEQLFGDANPVGKQVRLNGKQFRVIGVTAEETNRSLLGSGGFEFAIYAPIRALQQAMGSQQIHRVIAQTAPDIEPTRLQTQIHMAVLRSHGGSEDFTVLTQEELLGRLFTLLQIVSVALTGITSIALVVGGIGVMNVMLMSVTERVREIGIRKTVGAKQHDIFWQFLIEAFLIALVGGLMGVLIGWGVCAAIEQFTVLTPEVAPSTIALALSVCGAVGLIFGVLPAYRAAKRDPVEALRYE